MQTGIRKTLATLTLAALCVAPALANQASDRQNALDQKAFDATKASSGSWCGQMHAAEQKIAAPHELVHQVTIDALAFAAVRCLQAVQHETGPNSPATIIPREWLVIACLADVRNYPKPDPYTMDVSCAVLFPPKK
jgi:hypothetical protein